MENFKLISEHYDAYEQKPALMVGENNGKYEVRIAYEEPFMLLNTFDNYYIAVAFAEKEVS